MKRCGPLALDSRATEALPICPSSSPKKSSSRLHFDRWAARYERDRTSRWLATLQEEALAALDLRADDRLLDVGCGTGAAVRRAAALVERATGVDLSPAMIARARELAPDLRNVEFHEADSEHLPFPDGAFTAVLCTTSFHHYPDPGQATREMARVLVAGGRAVIGDACSDRPATRILDLALQVFQRSHVHFQRSEELESLLAEAGLSHQATRFLWKGGYVIMAARKGGGRERLRDAIVRPPPG
jgi:ubiquinone/menaquinone biosynthesis C-methylase UbiE